MKFGLIGLGYWGQNYVRLIHQRSDAELVAVCDKSTELVAFACNIAHSARIAPSPYEMVVSDDVEAVVVATPATTHYEFVRAALLVDKHVLCEKPLTMTVRECEDLLEVADASKGTLFVGHTFIYNSAVRAARDLVVAERLGLPLYAQATWAAPGPVRDDVNALWDLAPHPISILTYVLGRRLRSVSATGQAILRPRREDIVSLNLRFDSNASAHVNLSWLAPKKVRSVMFTGAQRIAIFDDMEPEPTDKLQVFETESIVSNGASAASAPVTRKLELPHRPVHVPDLGWREPLAAQLDHFLACCHGGLTSDSDGLAGMSVVRVLEAADSSLREGGRPVDVGVAVGLR